MAVSQYENETMQELLKETRDLGMTGKHLQVWLPSVTEDQSDKSILFKKQHKDAVIDLMKKRNFSALNAILEVSGITADEAELLDRLHELGINAQIIRDHRHEYRFHCYYYIKSMKSMMKTFKLSRDEMLREVKGLGSDEIEMLYMFYKQGLRREHLVALRRGAPVDTLHDSKHQHVRRLDQLYQDLLGYRYPEEKVGYLLTVINMAVASGKSWVNAFTTAAAEACMIRNEYQGHGADKRESWLTDSITSHRIHFLKRHAAQGIRAADVPPIFDDDRRAMYHVLRIIHRFSVCAALNEIHGLSDDQVKLMRKYYRAGATHDVLRRYPHSSQLTQSLLSYFKLRPMDGMKQLSALNSAQFTCLSEYAENGLSIEQAKSLSCDAGISKFKRDIVTSLVEKGEDPYEVLQRILPKSDEEALKSLDESAEFSNMLSVKI